MAREVVRVEGLEGVLDVLRKLPAEVVSKAGGPIKFGVKAAAEVLRDEAKQNVQRIIDEPNVGGVNKSTGLLKKSIIASRGRMPAGVNGEMYRVRIKPRQRYPESRGENLTAVQIGRQLEFGTEKRAPMPWLRPAFDAKKREALRVFVSEVNKRTTAAIKKLERQARTKR